MTLIMWFLKNRSHPLQVTSLSSMSTSILFHLFLSICRRSPFYASFKTQVSNLYCTVSASNVTSYHTPKFHSEARKWGVEQGDHVGQRAYNTWREWRREHVAPFCVLLVSAPLFASALPEGERCPGQRPPMTSRPGAPRIRLFFGLWGGHVATLDSEIGRGKAPFRLWSSTIHKYFIQCAIMG